jgi:hypothetical protein
VRSRSAVLGTVVLFALTGLAPAACQRRAAAKPAAMPAVRPVEQPAASAGGACILWDYGFIRDKIGVTFDVAAADQVDDTSSCVVQSVGGDYPDLMLSVVESTPADPKLFLSDLKPKKASTLKGLGRAGYRLDSAAAGDHGPSVEITWLSEAKQLQTLKFTFAKTATPADVTAMHDRLLALAKAMDTTNG